jgi:hypothetical protein
VSPFQLPFPFSPLLCLDLHKLFVTYSSSSSLLFKAFSYKIYHLNHFWLYNSVMLSTPHYCTLSSQTFSSCKTETLYPLNIWCPGAGTYLCFPPFSQTIFPSIFPPLCIGEFQGSMFGSLLQPSPSSLVIFMVDVLYPFYYDNSQHLFCELSPCMSPFLISLPAYVIGISLLMVPK